MKIDDILKQYKGMVNVERPETYIPFTAPTLNTLVGGEGVRSGRLIQLIGDKSSGKTTLALDLARNAQKMLDSKGEPRGVIYVDFERTYDKAYAAVCGVDVDSLYVVTPPTTEIGFDIIEQTAKAGAALIIIDSIPAAVPSIELEKEYSDEQKMAIAAAHTTRFCKRIVPILDDNNVLLVAINQWRANFSTMSKRVVSPFGPKQLQYSSSLTLELVRIKNEDNRTTVQVLVEKSKQGKEREKAEIIIEYGRGIDVAADIIFTARDRDIVQQTGAWFKYKDIRAQGLENAKVLFPIEEIRSQL